MGRARAHPRRDEAEYEAALRQWAALTDAGADAAETNGQVDRLQRAYLRIRMTPMGRAIVTRLSVDADPRIRGWAATHMLAWDPEGAREILARIRDLGGAGSLDAKWTLIELDGGRLRLDWDPDERHSK